MKNEIYKCNYGSVTFWITTRVHCHSESWQDDATVDNCWGSFIRSLPSPRSVPCVHVCDGYSHTIYCLWQSFTIYRTVVTFVILHYFILFRFMCAGRQETCIKGTTEIATEEGPSSRMDRHTIRVQNTATYSRFSLWTITMSKLQIIL